MVLLLSLLALVGMAYCDLHIFYEGWSPRTLQNASLGLDHSELHAHQCSAIGERRHPSSSDSGSSALLGYTPNRRAQPSTLDDSINERLQLAFVLALGAHQDGVYNYGEGGSMNGLLSVWDSWVENFFSVTRYVSILSSSSSSHLITLITLLSLLRCCYYYDTHTNTVPLSAFCACLT